MRKILSKIKYKIKDLFDAAKYKRKMNTFENKYNSRNVEYIKVLEDFHDVSMKNSDLRNQVKEQKKELKELKRIIEEDMIPKKKKKK